MDKDRSNVISYTHLYMSLYRRKFKANKHHDLTTFSSIIKPFSFPSYLNFKSPNSSVYSEIIAINYKMEALKVCASLVIHKCTFFSELLE